MIRENVEACARHAEREVIALQSRVFAQLNIVSTDRLLVSREVV